MSNIGYATISVIPSLQGAQGALAGQMAGPSAAAGTEAGGLFGGAFGAVLAGGAAVVAVGAGLAAIGGQFDEAFDNIRTKTGATGDELEGLKDVFRDVVASVPTDFATASDAIAGLSQRLHLTGDDLSGLSQQVLELSRITETDLGGNVDTVTRAFGDWGVETGQMSETLDQFFRASQLSGTSVADLATNVTNFGSPLRQLGFNLTDSLALFSRFEAEGVNTSTVMSGMRMAVKNLGSGFAQEETGVENFGAIIRGVREGWFDLSDAMTVFGARAGTDVFKAIEEGRFDLAEFENQIASGSDTILAAAEDTNDWRESLELLKNRALLLIEPVATRVFDALGQGADALILLGDTIKSGGVKAGFELLADVFAKLPLPLKLAAGAALFFVSPLTAVAAAAVYAYTHFEGFRNVVNGVVSWMTGTAWPAIRSFALGIAEVFGELVGWVRERWNSISEAIGHVLVAVRAIIGAHVAVVVGLWHTFGDEIVSVVKTMWSFVTNTVRNAINIVAGIIDLVMAVINGDWGKAWTAIKDIGQAVWDQILTVVRTAWGLLRNLISVGLSALKGLWRVAWAGIRTVLSAAWSAIRSVVSAGISAVISWFRGLPGRAVSALSRFGSMLMNVGRAAIRGLREGMAAAWSAVVDFVTSFPRRVINAIGDLGRTLYNKGRELMQGFKDGIQSMLGGILDMIGDIGSSIDGDVQDMLDQAGRSTAEVNKRGGGVQITHRMVMPVKTPVPRSARNDAISQRVVSTKPMATAITLDITGADDDLLRRIRKTVRVNGGNAQVVLGA